MDIHAPHATPPAPGIGEFVEVRNRPWLVEAVEDRGSGLSVLKLSCISDDAQGDQLEVAWGAEIGARILSDDVWSRIAENGTDDAVTFAAYLRTLKWNTATAADRDLFQAPFRAGIRLDAYQLLPLRKALRLPRVNLLIADDVGLGKTVEAGLILRELLLRRRIDFTLVAAPPAMTLQWQDELEAKFGLTFTVIDRERLAELRRLRGFGVNPWSTGSRFIVSTRLLTDEAYASGLRDILGGFRPRALLILDEAHHAAPASGARYAIDSQFTKAMRDIAGRFEHRLFLTATPHNGHSNSFSSLLEMLDPQRFTRGVEVRPRDLEPVMVRRLKEDLRRIGEPFPERVIEPIVLANLPADTVELRLASMLSDYGELRGRRISRLPRHQVAQAKLVFVGLQQRLLSSVAAFAKTLDVHRKSLRSVAISVPEATVTGFVRPSDGLDDLLAVGTEKDAEAALDADEEAAARAATQAGSTGSSEGDIQAELTLVDEMLAIARPYASRPDARVRWLGEWIKQTMCPGGRWNTRRLILFTEYEDTRRWMEKRLLEIFGDIDGGEDRIGVFSGITGTDRREAIKRAFNADPTIEPLRILICTDAAREGINLQTHCYDLIHVDLPWNPSRLEQRNGRIDRKLQPSPKVFCRYFRYSQRPEDVVLDALVRKTETIRMQLGSAGRVIEERITDRLVSAGINRRRAQAEADAIQAEADPDRTDRAVAEMDDAAQARQQRLLRDLDDLRKALERSRERVGVDHRELQQVVATALQRAGSAFQTVSAVDKLDVPTFTLDPDDLAFAHDPAWADVFDDLRDRRRRRGERLNEWRRATPIRAISFQPPTRPEVSNVVQLHLEHRLVRRLLSRFLSQGFQAGLQRVCAVVGPGAQPRAVLIGRLAVYGPGAARLHEEFVPVTAIWSEADRDRRSLRPLGERGQETTLDQLEDALRDARAPTATVVARLHALARHDADDLEPELIRRAALRLAEVTKDLAARGDAEATSLADLLRGQRDRISKAAATPDDLQLSLPGIAEEERRQREQDRRHWAGRVQELERELESEPERVRAGYAVRAHRLEPVGLVYLWPVTG
jgi:hypothetical protein